MSRTAIPGWLSARRVRVSQIWPSSLRGEARRPGVARVLEQRLDDRRGPLHHLSGSDLVGDVLLEDADAAFRHDVSLYRPLPRRARSQSEEAFGTLSSNFLSAAAPES